MRRIALATAAIVVAGLLDSADVGQDTTSTRQTDSPS